MKHFRGENEMERNRVVSGILLAVVLMILLTPYTQRDVLVLANPVIRGPFTMPFELINITVSFVDGELLAKVNATYMFQNFAPDIMRIDYPLPPNAQRVSVALDNRSLLPLFASWFTNGTPQTLEWTYNSRIYSTAIGDWPMINFTIDRAGSYFNPSWFGLEVYYEHFLPFADGNFTYLYALGSSRYAEHYSDWGRLALVTVRILMNYTDLSVFTVGYSNESWTWTPATYTLIKETKQDTITFGILEIERLFTEDFLVVLTRPLFDLTGDLKVDVRDLAIAARAFGSCPGHPNWKPIADINRDGEVDIRDLVFIAKNFGRTYS